MCFLKLYGNAIIGQIFIINHKFLTNRNKSQAFQISWIIRITSWAFLIPCLNLGIYEFRTSEPIFVFKPKFSSNQLKEEARVVTTPMVFIMQKQTSCSGKAQPLLITGANFSPGSWSMNQSKIAIGNKTTVYICIGTTKWSIIIWRMFPGVDFHWWIKPFFWGIVPIGGYRYNTWSHTTLLINTREKMEENKEAREEENKEEREGEEEFS